MIWDFVTPVLAGAAILALWDYGKTRLRMYSFAGDKLINQTAALVKALETHTVREANMARSIDDAVENMRAVLGGFINSATAIITISEEEKKILRNKVNAAKLNQRI